MNIKQYLDNPMGKGAIIPGKQMILEDLNKRYNKLISEKEIQCIGYKNGDNYLYHLIIPSESERDNTYDVVLEFIPKDKTDIADEVITNYDIKFFSNCPSFIYTYAYAYNLNGVFIDYLDKKLQKEIFKMPPLVKNPNNTVNFEKSIYYACKYLVENKDHLTKLYLKSTAKRYNKKEFFNSIRHHDQIINEIKKAKIKLKEEKEREAKANKPYKRTKNKMDHKNSPNSVNLIKPKKTTVKNKSNVNKVNKINSKKSITTRGKSNVKKVNKIKKR